MAHRTFIALSKNLPKPIRREKQIKEFKNLLVLDFEATCLENKIIKPQEIIEFPCFVVSSYDWQIKDVFHEYVKPRINPVLSDFCTELTGIMQETVDNEQHFPQVFAAFCQWLKEGNYFDQEDTSAFVTCGDWDLKVMLPNQCKLDNIELPSYFNQWINLKTTYCSITKYYPRSLSDMIAHLNMKVIGKAHSGIDDVHNMTRVIQTLVSKHKEPQFTINSTREIVKKSDIIY